MNSTVIGTFEVDLTIPIVLAPGFVPSHITFDVDDGSIVLKVLHITDPVKLEYGDWEFPELTRLHVTISRKCNLQLDGNGEQSLTREEQQEFESVLVEAVRRFASLARSHTNQSRLDIQHPIHAYRDSYTTRDGKVNYGGLEPGTSRLPRYVLGGLSLNPRDFYKELDIDIWRKVESDILATKNIPDHEELLHDAQNFRSNLRYDVAVLYAAIAAEIMFEKSCRHLLRKAGLNDSQIDGILENRTAGSLSQLLKKLNGSIKLEMGDLFKLRNQIAHGRDMAVKSEDAHEAISIALKLNVALQEYLHNAEN